ncbi:hypothetical protein MYSI104531_08230 [Mycobacterium simiae]
MQITVHPGMWPCVGPVTGGGGAIQGNIGWVGLTACGWPVRSISGIRAMGSSWGRPIMLIGKPGPSPSGCSSCALPSGGGGPVIGGRSTGTTPVAYAAAQPNTFCA